MIDEREISSLDIAVSTDVKSIFTLVNDAYRGDVGWTRETHLISGNRVTMDDIESIMANPTAHLLIAKNRQQIIGCICIQHTDDAAYIGMFAVHPTYQAKGLGKSILRLAEEFASTQLGVKKYIMVVVSQRIELITYYERRGYLRTGSVEEYPLHLNVGVPVVNGLTVEYLEKYVD